MQRQACALTVRETLATDAAAAGGLPGFWIALWLALRLTVEVRSFILTRAAQVGLREVPRSVDLVLAVDSISALRVAMVDR